MTDEAIELCIDDLESVKQRAVRAYLASPLTSQAAHSRLQNNRARRAITQQLKESRHALFDVYDPADHTQPGSSHSSKEVYQIDLRETITSDLIILHANAPSTGLGIEAQLAANATVPRVIISPKNASLSRMLLGIPSHDLAIIEYEKITDLKSKLSDRLPEIARAVVSRLPARRRFMDAV